MFHWGGFLVFRHHYPLHSHLLGLVVCLYLKVPHPSFSPKRVLCLCLYLIKYYWIRRLVCSINCLIDEHHFYYLQLAKCIIFDCCMQPLNQTPATVDFSDIFSFIFTFHTVSIYHKLCTRYQSLCKYFTLKYFHLSSTPSHIISFESSVGLPLSTVYRPYIFV